MTSPWTEPVILTLCLSVLALLVSITALAWQIVSWRRSGPRLRVVTRWGVAGSLPEPRWFISIDINNAGRLATEVNQVGFQLSRAEARKQIVDVEDVLGTPIALPRTLAPGASTSVMYGADRLLAVLREEGLSGRRARPYADTGHGRTIGKRRRDLASMAAKLTSSSR